jgi:hypothetical protein
MKRKYLILVKFIIIMIFFHDENLYCQEFIHEGFDSGMIAPQGWVLKVGGVYTTTSASGTAIPSIKFSSTGNYIETSEFEHADECSFFIKGYGTDSISALNIYYKAGEIWHRLDSLTHLSAVKKILIFPLPDSAEKLRFVYFKSLGNLAFDDLIVRKTHGDVDTLPPVFIDEHPKVVSLSDTSVLFSVSINKPGLVHFIISSENCPIPDDKELLNFGLYDSVCMIYSETINFLQNTDTMIMINGLKPGSKYASYWLASSVNKDTALTGAHAICKFLLSKVNNNLFFSEIIRGSGNNKAIEIFNPTEDTLSLNNYRIALSTNGEGWKTSYYNFPLGKAITPLDVFVILKANADTSVVDFSIADD